MSSTGFEGRASTIDNWHFPAELEVELLEELVAVVVIGRFILERVPLAKEAIASSAEEEEAMGGKAAVCVF